MNFEHAFAKSMIITNRGGSAQLGTTGSKLLRKELMDLCDELEITLAQGINIAMYMFITEAGKDLTTLENMKKVVKAREPKEKEITPRVNFCDKCGGAYLEGKPHAC